MKRQLSAKLFTNKSLVIGISVIAALFVINLSNKIQAQSVNELRGRSNELQKDIENNAAAAEEKHEEGDTLEEAIGALDNEISATTQQINTTAGKITQLDADLKQKQKELIKAKELLKLNMEALYKRGDASTVELIVGSDSFSQFIDEQEYLERIKTGIQDAAKKVIKLKKQIKAQKAEQEELLQKQEVAKASLNDTRVQRSKLLKQTRGQEAEYKEVVKELKQKRQQVEDDLKAKILAQQLASQGSVSSGGPGGVGGTVIGRVGMTGFTFGPHLHFEMRNSGFNPINPYSAGGFNWPVPSSHSVSQGFGCVPYYYYATPCAGGSLHAGLDIAAPVGTPVIAARPGNIIHRGDDGDGYGNKVVIKHNDGTYSLYAHLSY